MGRKKKEDIQDFCTASVGAEILSTKNKRAISPDYIRTMARSQKHAIRSIRLNSRSTLYHKDDLAACIIRQKGNRENATTNEA